MSVVNSTISSSNYEIFSELLPLTVDPILLWAANRKNVPTASPASGYQSDSDYSYGSSSPESEYGFGTLSFLDALNSDLTETNTQPNVKGCLGGEELMSAIVPNLQDWSSAFGPDQMPDTDFLLNLDDQVLKNTEENYPYNPTCLPNSPASSSSCDDGYGSDVLEISSIESGSPQPVEALPEEAFSPQPEEVQVVPACPPQMQPEIKPTKPVSRTGRRKRGPRSLTLNNGNGPTQLWQFLLNLLTHGPKGLVQWTHDEPFEFKLLNPCAVATMWGKVKNKPSMNYEKLSRGLRYYYGKKILEKVHGKRYVYQFQCDIPKILGYDPTATDPKQNVEDAVCDSPDVADETSDIFEECPSSVSSEDSSGECWEIGPGLW